MEFASPLIGAVLLLLLGLDVFVTVFHPEGHGGPLTRRQNRGLWYLWKGLAPSGEQRDRWLALAGPVLALLTPAVWAILLVVGFGLIYFPWMEHFLVSPGTLRAHWAEALYFSGFAAATLGTGDIVPDLVPLRLLSVFQALCGFALLSSALSYVLAIYREHGKKTTLAADLSLHYAQGRSGGEDEVAAERERWLEGVARDLQHAMQSHAQYPILHYFRPAEERQSLAVQLRPLLELNAKPTPSDSDAQQRPSRGAALVSQSLGQYLASADNRFVRSANAQGGDQSTLGGRYNRLMTYLGYRPD
jgi:hypothetical protein